MFNKPLVTASEHESIFNNSALSFLLDKSVGNGGAFDVFCDDNLRAHDEMMEVNSDQQCEPPPFQIYCDAPSKIQTQKFDIFVDEASLHEPPRIKSAASSKKESLSVFCDKPSTDQKREVCCSQLDFNSNNSLSSNQENALKSKVIL